MFPVHGLSLAFCHPSIDGLYPRIHVDIDEILTVIVDDDSSFDDAGDGIPRSGAVPKSTAGAVLEGDTVPSLDYGGQEEEGGIKTREEHAERIATAAGVHIMPIGRKHRRLFLFRIRWKRRHLFIFISVTYRQAKRS